MSDGPLALLILSIFILALGGVVAYVVVDVWSRRG